MMPCRVPRGPSGPGLRPFPRRRPRREPRAPRSGPGAGKRRRRLLLLLRAEKERQQQQQPRRLKKQRRRRRRRRASEGELKRLLAGLVCCFAPAWKGSSCRLRVIQRKNRAEPRAHSCTLKGAPRKKAKRTNANRIEKFDFARLLSQPPKTKQSFFFFPST